MNLTRREFLKKSAIIAGGVAVATTIPSLALAGVKKEAPVQLASVTTGYAQAGQMTTGRAILGRLNTSETRDNLQRTIEYSRDVYESRIKAGDKFTIEGFEAKPGELKVFTVTDVK